MRRPGPGRGLPARVWPGLPASAGEAAAARNFAIVQLRVRPVAANKMAQWLRKKQQGAGAVIVSACRGGGQGAPRLQAGQYQTRHHTAQSCGVCRRRPFAQEYDAIGGRGNR